MTSLEIMKTVAAWHRIPWHVFVSPIMVREVSICRWEAWWLCRTINAQSYPLIGRICDFNHTSVLYGTRKFNKMILDGRAVDHRAELLEGRTPENVAVWHPSQNTVEWRKSHGTYQGWSDNV